jgi:hypothetical protein
MLVSVCFYNLVAYTRRIQGLYSACVNSSQVIKWKFVCFGAFFFSLLVVVLQMKISNAYPTGSERVNDSHTSKGKWYARVNFRLLNNAFHAETNKIKLNERLYRNYLPLHHMSDLIQEV